MIYRILNRFLRWFYWFSRLRLLCRFNLWLRGFCWFRSWNGRFSRFIFNRLVLSWFRLLSWLNCFNWFRNLSRFFRFCWLRIFRCWFFFYWFIFSVNKIVSKKIISFTIFVARTTQSIGCIIANSDNFWIWIDIWMICSWFYDVAKSVARNFFCC